MKTSKIIGLFLLLTSISTSCFAQVYWEKNFGAGSELGRDGIETFDNGLIFTSKNAASSPGKVTKTDLKGNILWSKSFSGSCIQETSDSCYVLAGSGSFPPKVSIDLFITKFDSLGNIIWTKAYGKDSIQEEAVHIEQTFDKGFIVCGFKATGPGLGGIWLLRLNNSGDTLWTKTFGGLELETSAEVQQTSDSGFVLCGRGGAALAYIVKTDAYGTMQWSKKYTGIGQAESIRQTNDGGYIFGAYNLGLVKINAQGDTLWTKRFPDYRFYSVKQTPDGGYICTGYVMNTITKQDICLVKTDANGNTQWSKTFMKGTKYDAAESVRILKDKGFLLCGYTNFTGANFAMYVVKTDSMGSLDTALTVGTMAPEELAFSMYPNPVKEILSLSLHGNPNEAAYLISDMMGREVLSGNFYDEGTQQINVGGLSRGIYIIHISTREKTSYQKIIKE